MALTEAQRITVHEILGLPVTTSVYYAQTAGLIESLTLDATYNALVQVEAILAALTSEQQTRLIVYVDRWDVISTYQGSQVAGAVASVTGMNVDPDRERSLITERVTKMLNFNGISSPAASASVPLIR